MGRFVLLSAILLSSTAAAQDIITTVAGGGPNNMPATSANVSQPFAVATDVAGNVYVAANGANRVFRIDAASGLLFVAAGVGHGGSAGDGGQATAAALSGPSGVAVDATGNLFIADQNNNRIRRVDKATGVITTVAGTGVAGFSGDGGPATSATLRSPIGVTLDAAGDLFFGDSSNHRVRRVNATTGVITTVAGNGSAGFAGDGGLATSASLQFPRGMAFDGAGNLYITDSFNGRIRRVNSAGIITTVAGNGGFSSSGDGGPATLAGMNPTGVAADAAGNIFIADFNGRIRRVDATGVITSVAAGLSGPIDAAVVGAGNLLIAEFSANRVRRRDGTTGVLSTIAGNGTANYSGDGAAATTASLRSPTGMAADAAGNLFIADQANSRVRRVDAATAVITTAAGNGSFGSGGDGGLATNAAVSSPTGVALDAQGNLFITDGGNRIRRVASATGIITTVAGTSSFGFSGDNGSATLARLNNAVGVAVDASGRLYIGDQTNHRVRRVDTAGIITTVAGNGTGGFSGDNGVATSASLNNPYGVAVDAVGNLFIADQFNHRIRRVSAVTGVITTLAGSGVVGSSGDGGPATSARLFNPTGVAVDSAGNVFIADQGNNRIRRVDATTNVITTVAGTGIFGFSGDGGVPTGATVATPTGVAADAFGRLYIADTSNHRIRRVAPANTVPTANAGADQTVEATSGAGATVTLDGNGSSDPDGQLLTYEWRDSANAVVGSAASIALTVPLGSHTYTLVVDDGHGPTASDQVEIIVRDTTGASIAITSPAAVTYALNQAVPAAYTCDDAVSGVSSCLGTVANDAAVQTSNAGSHTFSVTATDGAGNITTADVEYDVAKGAQTIGFTALANKTLGDAPFQVSATGGASGNPVTFSTITPAVCSSSGTDGATITIIATGGCTIRASQAGNADYEAASSVDQSFTIRDLVTRSGFYEPVSSIAGAINTVKGGSTVPLKFTVTVNGVEKTDTSGLQFSVAQVACAGGVEDAVDFVTTGGTSLRYDTAAHQFVQNWQTAKAAGFCFVARMTTTADGGSLSALFKMK